MKIKINIADKYGYPVTYCYGCMTDKTITIPLRTYRRMCKMIDGIPIAMIVNHNIYIENKHGRTEMATICDPHYFTSESFKHIMSKYSSKILI